MNGGEEMRSVAQLRAALDETAVEAVTSAPPWERIEERLLRTRRRRRLRAAATLTTGLVAVTVLTGVAQVTGLPDRLRGSAQVADAPDADAPEPGITWGRLGDDPAWVGSFQNWLSDAYLPTAHAGEVPQPGPVHVVFADDIGGYRVALAQVPQASPNAQDPAQGNLWFAGPEGAGPTELTGLTFDEGREDDPFWSTVVPETVRDPIPWVVVTPEPLGGKVSSRESVVVALTAAARDLVLFARPDIAADGAVSWQRTRLRRSAPSVYTAVLRDLPPGPVTLRRPGGEVGTQWEDNAYSAMKDPIELQWGLRVVGEDEIPVRAFQPLYPGDLLQGVLPPLHEGFTPPDEQLRPAVHQAQRASGVAPQDSTRRLLASVSWRRTAPGTDVIAVTVPSGAHVVTVVHRPFSFVLDAVTVLPAGTLETAGLAWAEERPGVGNVVAVLRQKGAVSARVTVDGRAHSVRLDSEITVSGIKAPGENQTASVAFLDSSGTTIGTTPVLARGSSTPQLIPPWEGTGG
ncbi:MAG: hypothetical protein GXX79_20005 [Actinomycetales bacterium]|nr:hypothetical protein [Actinomycetales bacterium]